MRSKEKSDNRRALPKYILVLFIAAFFGALAGFAAGIVGAGNLSESIKTAVNTALTAAAPWGIPVTSVVFLGLGWWFYAKARRLYSTWDGEAEEPVDTAEETLSWALLMSAIALLWDFFFLSVLVVCGAGSPLERLGGVALFLVSVVVIVVHQQKVVDLTRRINPEKQGSVYDLKFQKKWMDSCDESEKRQIGQACYKAYRAASNTCLWLWVVLLVVHYAFDTGLLPIAAVLVVFGVLQVVYTLECIRLSRKGGGAWT
jgi:hypothetical protein